MIDIQKEEAFVKAIARGARALERIANVLERALDDLQCVIHPRYIVHAPEKIDVSELKRMVDALDRKREGREKNGERDREVPNEKGERESG